jgi:hypothetical protein
MEASPLGDLPKENKVESNVPTTLNLDSILVVVGGTLLCASLLTLSQAPRIRSGIGKFAQNPDIQKIGREVAGSLVRGVGATLTRLGADLLLPGKAE